MTTKYVLTIAGSDILSGGGLQSDLATFAVEGVHGFLALTATTALVGNEFAIYPNSTIHFAQQLDSLRDLPFSAIKIGLLPTPEIAALTLEFIQDHPGIPVVLDPVMVFKENQDQQVNRMREQLLQFLPYVTVLTPNLREAELLTQRELTSKEDMERAAQVLQKAGVKAVVIKGGKRLDTTQALDVLYDGQEIEWLDFPLLEKNTNGAGCTFASSIASRLAKEDSVRDAVRFAKNFVYQAIKHSNEYGVVQYDTN